ncbi:MAG: PDGLE domain-containing protein [Chloroflexi bacterium]|nr:PDGLE domain-containing protein [Chloroflexota bacterium]
MPCAAADGASRCVAAGASELHIPDGFLNLPVSLLCWLVALPLIWLALRRSSGDLGERQIPLMGVMAAFIFAAQMINFPVVGGTSGHLLGGALAAITLGPWAAMLVMTAVIGVQALLFQDGGLVVLGANVLNMGLLTTSLGYGLYRVVAGQSLGRRLAVAGVAAWLSVMAGALATSIQLWLSSSAQLAIVLPAMLGVHALIGIGEALITVAALSFIVRARPDLLAGADAPARGGRGWIVAGLGVALATVLIAPLASSDPDGLETVAKNLGFSILAADLPFAVLPSYTIPFLGESGLSTILAGAIGAAVVAAIGFGLARLRRPAPPADLAPQHPDGVLR